MDRSATDSPIPCLALGTNNPKTCNFQPFRIHRRPVGADDILIDLKFCGVCHTDIVVAAKKVDLAMVGGLKHPCVPGHEIAGVVAAVGANVPASKFQVGDCAGVGCFIDSCRSCEKCKTGREQFCDKAVLTYGSVDKNGRAGQVSLESSEKGSPVVDKKQQTLGGYSSKLVVNKDFCIKIPQSYRLEAAGPILCAGATVYSPMKKYKVGK